MLKKEEIDAIKIRAIKNLKPESQTFSDIERLYESHLALCNENARLKQNLFDLEQAAPEEQQWQNVIATKLDRAVSSDGKDYLEINNSINNEIYTISIQRKFGKTPKQLLDQSEIRRLKASKKVLNLLREKRVLEAALAKLNIEVNAFKILTGPSDNTESEVLARTRLDIMIKIVNRCINTFNNTLYRRSLNKLHESTKSSFHEAWARAVEAEVKARGLLEDNQKLKHAFLKRKSSICRIYKKRQKKGAKRLRQQSF